MSGKGIREAIQVEWINVTYRSVAWLVLILLLTAVGSTGAWFYFFRLAPQSVARAAIQRAEARFSEASGVEKDGIPEILDGARSALADARSEFDEAAFDGSRIAAIRSENLSLQAITLAGGSKMQSRLVRIDRIEGDVRVKPAGEFSWKRASLGMVLRVGDQVKTSSSASAELHYFDGTVTTIRPGSLLEIRDLYEDPVTNVRRVQEKLTWGEVRASTQKRNVSGSYHEVKTDKVSARAEDAGEFRVVHNKQQKTSTVDVFGGKLRVSTATASETVKQGERVRARADGGLTAKQSLPGVPRLIAPSDQRVFIFEAPLEEQFTLTWEQLPGIERFHLMISDNSLFTKPLYDAEREGLSAVLDGVEAGSYYWRVAALSATGVHGPYSEARRFRVSSQQIRDHTDRLPPKLEITEFVPIGQMVIINGQTEPGATLWVNEDKIDVFEDGSFNTVVKLRREGLNELVLVAQDTAGNESRTEQVAYVESY